MKAASAARGEAGKRVRKLGKSGEKRGKARKSAFYSHVENAANMHTSNSGRSSSSVVSTYAGDSKRKREKRRNKGNSEGGREERKRGEGCVEKEEQQHMCTACHTNYIFAVCIVWCIARKSMLRFVQKGVQEQARGRERKCNEDSSRDSQVLVFKATHTRTHTEGTMTLAAHSTGCL